MNSIVTGTGLSFGNTRIAPKPVYARGAEKMSAVWRLHNYGLANNLRSNEKNYNRRDTKPEKVQLKCSEQFGPVG